MNPYDMTVDEYDQLLKDIFQPESKSDDTDAKEDYPVENNDDVEVEVRVNTECTELQPVPDKFIDFTPKDQIYYKFDKEAKLYGHFCTLVLIRLENCTSRVDEWKLIADDYNNRKLVPDLYHLRGQRTERALRSWLEKYVETGLDMYSLIHKNKNQVRERRVTELERTFLLNVLLNPNKISIGTAITTIKNKARLGLCESTTSKPTLRRWCDEWQANNPAIWSQARLGSKYVAEHIVKTIIRDDTLLNVGDVWVADGHVLAFDIKNPITGRAQRMTMILVLDWASRYPVGASLTLTEDSQHIQIAFRNGFLNWRALPKYVYLDNGKAFRAKIFHEQWEDHDLEKELGGIFPRLNIGASFAESYNAKAKIIERFFKTFQEQFERFISSFRGASIADKPSTLMRNEKWAQKLFKSEPPTLDEAMRMISFYIRYVYGEAPHGALKGKSPWQVFSQAALPEDRIVEPAKLNFMMLTAERKAVRNDGIIFNKLQYWHIALVDHIGKPVIFRYDLSDARWILVYDLKDKFICQAELRRTQHPFIPLAMDQPIAHKDLQKEYKLIKKIRRNTEQATKTFVRRTQENVDALVLPYQTLQVKNSTFSNPPMIEAPLPGPDQFIENLEHQIMQQAPALENTQQKPNLVFIPKKQIDQSEETAREPFNNKSFDEMLKFIGIK